MRNKITLLFVMLLIALPLLFACGEPEQTKLPEGAVESDGLIYAPTNEGTAYEIIGVSSEKEEYTPVSAVNGLPVVAVGNSAFYNNKTLKKITLPEGVVKIGLYAFDNCKNLEYILIPDSVKEIKFNAFSDCEKLREVRLPASLETIGTNAFSRCYSLENLYVNSSLAAVEKDAFFSCTALDGVYIDSMASWCKIEFENVEANPLYYAENLYVGGTLSNNLKIEGVETVGHHTFFGFKGLETLVLGEGVITIDNSAFSNCVNLKTVVLSDTVENIGKSAFNTCSSLEYITVGRGVKRFEGLAFYACTSLYAVEILDLAVWCDAFFYTDNSGSANPMRYADTVIIDGEETLDLYIPDDVKVISTLAFIGFKGRSVSLPESLKTIEKTAFYWCKNLTTIYYRGNSGGFQRLSVGQNNFEMVTKENIFYEK